MSLTHFPNGISSFGMPILGAGPIVTTGNIFFVDSATGNNVNDGLDPDHPVATIDYAIGLCTANKGDVIVAMPNHTENITAAGTITCDIEGVKIVGLGHGDNRPELVWTSSSAATVLVSADSVRWENVVFKTGSSTAGSTGAMVIGIDVNDNHCEIINCVINNSGAAEALTCVELDTNASDFKMIGCECFSSSGGADNIIDLHDTGAALRGIEIAYNWMAGDFDEGCIYSSASDLKEILIHHNYFRNDAAGIACVDVGTSAEENEGFIAYNIFDCSDSAALASQDATTSLMVPAENYAGVFTGGGVSAVLTPSATYAS